MVIQNYDPNYIGAKPISTAPAESSQKVVSNDKKDSPESEYVKDKARLQEKLSSLNNKISRLKDKIASGKSDSQDRIQYSRYVNGREEVISKLKNLERNKQESLSRPKAEITTTKQSNTPTSSTQTAPSTEVKPGQSLYLEVTPEGVSSDVLTAPDTNAKTNLMLSDEGKKQVFAKKEKDTPPIFTAPKNVSGQETKYVEGQGLVNVREVRSQAQDVSISQEAIKQINKGGIWGYTSGTTLGVIGLGIGAGKGVVGTAEFFSPYSFTQRKAQVPIFGPAVDTIKSVPQIPQYFRNEPFEAVGMIGGMFLGGKLVSKPVNFVSSKAKPYVVGDRSAYISGSEQFMKYGFESRVKQFESSSKGGEFVLLDKSGGVRANTLTKVTNDKYVAQTTLEGDVIIKPRTTEGFLSREGFKLEEGKSPSIDIVRVRTTEGELVTAVQSSTGQTNLQKFGFSKNSWQSVRGIEATNPTYEIIDLINPRNNKFVDRPSTQKYLLEPDSPKVGGSRNTLKELYAKSDKTISDNSISNKPVYGDSEVVLIEETLPTDLSFKPSPKLKISSKYANDGPGTELKVSDATFDSEILAMPEQSSGVLGRRVKPINLKEYRSELNTSSTTIQALGQDNKVMTNLSLKSLQTPKIASIPLSGQDSRTAQLQTPELLQQQEIVLEQLQIPIQELRLREQTTPQNKLTPKNTYLVNLDLDLNKKKKRKSSSKLFVRKKGKFQYVGNYDTPEIAFDKGKSIVSETSTASFKVESSGVPQRFNMPPGSNLYNSRKDSTIYIEKPKFRINRPTELREITFKGLQTQRERGIVLKRKKVKFF